MADLSARQGLRMLLVVTTAGILYVLFWLDDFSACRTTSRPARPASDTTTTPGSGAIGTAAHAAERPQLADPTAHGTGSAHDVTSTGTGIGTDAGTSAGSAASVKPQGMKARLRGHLSSIDVLINDCVAQATSRGTHHTGRVTLTFIAGRDKNGFVTVESTGDDDEESTVKDDDALVACLHPLVKPFALHLDEGVEYTSVHWYVEMKGGEVTNVGVSSYTNRRAGELPTD